MALGSSRAVATPEVGCHLPLTHQQLHTRLVSSSHRETPNLPAQLNPRTQHTAQARVFPRSSAVLAPACSLSPAGCQTRGPRHQRPASIHSTGAALTVWRRRGAAAAGTRPGAAGTAPGSRGRAAAAAGNRRTAADAGSRRTRRNCARGGRGGVSQTRSGHQSHAPAAEVMVRTLVMRTTK